MWVICLQKGSVKSNLGIAYDVTPDNQNDKICIIININEGKSW